MKNKKFNFEKAISFIILLIFSILFLLRKILIIPKNP